MFAASHQRYKYSADYYRFVVDQLKDVPEVKYYFSHKVSLIAGIDGNQRMIIRSQEVFPVGTVIKDIKDADGNNILDDSAWQISSTTPILNAFNVIESYRMKAIPYIGDL